MDINRIKGEFKVNKTRCIFCGIAEDDLLENGKYPILMTVDDAAICEKCIEETYDMIQESKKAKEQNKLSKGKLPKPSEIRAHLDQYIIGQEDAKEVLSVAVYNHYKTIRYMKTNKNSDIEIKKSNIMLLGPTGTGKTAILECLSKFLNVPFAISDATNLTAAGYVGEDVENVVRKLIEAADGDIERAQHGIIYIDEIDKIGRKGENVSITRDVGGESVQQSILKIVEGALVEVPPKGGRKHPNQECIKIDTTNILFIVGGSFEGIEKIVSKRLKVQDSHSGIGFGATIKESKDETLSAVIDKIEIEDLKKFGMIPEFLGRFPVFATLKPLKENDLIRIMTEPKNALVKQYKALFNMDNVILTIKEEAIREIAKLSIKRETGARGLRSIMENILRKTMYNAPDQEALAEVVINKECITENKEPVYIVRKVG